jgi:hypothetical protein
MHETRNTSSFILGEKIIANNPMKEENILDGPHLFIAIPLLNHNSYS